MYFGATLGYTFLTPFFLFGIHGSVRHSFAAAERSAVPATNLGAFAGFTVELVWRFQKSAGVRFSTRDLLIFMAVCAVFLGAFVLSLALAEDLLYF